MTNLCFSMLGVTEPLCRALVAENYLTPTPIQAQTIPLILAGRDVVGIAQTGTGKTAAFGLPLLQRLAENRVPPAPRSARALILAPTRELALQIDQSLRTYGQHLHLRHAVILGGINQNKQIASMRQGVDILVATPGRLLDLVNQKHIILGSLTTLIIDEADRMFDMGFIRDVRKIVNNIPRQRQGMLFSATMPTDVAHLVKEMLQAPAGGAESAELRSYVMARLLWDVSTNVRQDIEEFHHAYYGAAAPPMLEYFDLLHQQVRATPGGKGAHMWIFDPVTAEYLGPEFLAKAKVLFQRAAALAKEEDVRRRVHKARLSIDYVEVNQSKRFLVKDGWYAPEDLSLKSRWNTLMSDARSFGMDAIHEHFLMADDIALFEQRIQPYRVVTLENTRVAVHVVPALEGRVVSFVDTGREMLFHPDAGDRQYPNVGGLRAAPRTDYVATDVWDTKWGAEPEMDKSAIVLIGTSANGCQIRRTLRLINETATLLTETTLMNRGNGAVEAALMTIIEVAPPDIETLALAFSKRDGSIVQKKLLAPKQRPIKATKHLRFAGRRGPAGEARNCGLNRN